jgi:hypothetical protein
MLAAVLIGCVSSLESPTATESVIRITSPAGFSKPLLYSWDLGDTLLIPLGDRSLAILGVQLSVSETKIFYSLSGKGLDQFWEEIRFEIEDNSGQLTGLEEVIPFAISDDLLVGIMNFGSRATGATELILHVDDGGKYAGDQIILLARFDGPPTEDRNDLRYTIGRPGGVEQSGYKIVMYLSYPPSKEVGANLPEQNLSRLTAQTTATPASLFLVPWAELAEGIEVSDLISISVEDLEEKQVNFLIVQLLSDGNALGAYNESVISPVPIIVTSPTAVPYPYP